uniref:Thyroglobulin type-1 domain-containing protein n=1 Tax=Scleropages formosus TaxID=113540 RepID=A0A8C9RK37_SCLFO
SMCTSSLEWNYELRVNLHCDAVTPKCRLMHLEMLNKRRTGSILPGGRLDMEYDPECDEHGMFKPKQCDDDSNLCWCVDSAGVRVTDKTGDDPKCDRLVRVQLLSTEDGHFAKIFLAVNAVIANVTSVCFTASWKFYLHSKRSSPLWPELKTQYDGRVPRGFRSRSDTRPLCWELDHFF